MSIQPAVELGPDLRRDLEVVASLLDQAVPELLDQTKTFVSAQLEGCFFRGFHEATLAPRQSAGLDPELARSSKLSAQGHVHQRPQTALGHSTRVLAHPLEDPRMYIEESHDLRHSRPTDAALAGEVSALDLTRLQSDPPRFGEVERVEDFGRRNSSERPLRPRSSIFGAPTKNVNREFLLEPLCRSF